jgi:kynureninase
VRPDLLPTLKPTATGWFAHKQPFAFDMRPIDYADDVWRMIGGTPPMPAVYAARAGWEILAKAGVENIRKKSLRQTKLLRELVDARGFTVNTPRDDAARGGTICFDFEGAEPVSRELSRRKFFHDYRPRCGLRVSPHLYTTDDELEHFMAELDLVRKSPPTTAGARTY